MRFLARFCVVLYYSLIVIPIIILAFFIYHVLKGWLHRKG